MKKLLGIVVLCLTLMGHFKFKTYYKDGDGNLKILEELIKTNDY